MSAQSAEQRRSLLDLRRRLTARAGSWNVELTCENLTWAAVAVGVVLRIWEYLDFRELYMDEVALLKNIVGHAIFDFSQILSDDQMAPPGFLAIERLLVLLPLGVKVTARFFPLVCGIASVFLMRAVSRRYLDRRAMPLAVTLLALGDHLLYYSSEIKQYSGDLVVALAALLLAAPRPHELLSRNRLAVLAIFGLLAPWFSFTSVFVLAGVGLHLLWVCAMQRDWRRTGAAVGIGLAWLMSFAGCFLLSRSIMSRRDFLWIWWNFAFLPVPPRSLADASLLAESVANVFINPASVLTPLSLPYTASLASIMAVCGCFSLGRRWGGGLFLMLSPLVLALVASGLRQYPFHGRLLFCLIPSFLLLLSEGVAAIGGRTGWPVTLILAGCFVYGEAAEVTWHRAIQGRTRMFDSHGDLKNDLLDYLEARRRPRSAQPAREVPAGGDHSDVP